MARIGEAEIASGTTDTSGMVRRLPGLFSPDGDDRSLLQQVIAYYHETLKQAPEALAYLKARGVDHPEAITRFKLGFANRTLGLRLPAKNRVAGRELRGRLQRLGILRGSGHEHFNGALVVPVLDEAGDVLHIYGRKIRDDLRPGTAYHLDLPGPPRGAWNLEGMRGAKETILTGGLIDALTFWCAGYRNVTASYGIEGFTDEHLAAFSRYRIKRVLIAYGRTDAGEGAASALAGRLMAEGLEAWRILFPRGLDANAYAVKSASAVKSLGDAIRKAVWLGRGAAPARAASKPEPPEMQPREAGPPATPPATPVPLPAVPDTKAEVTENEVTLVFGDRRYRARGLGKNLAFDVMKVNLLASRGEGLHVDTLDLYSARARAAYVAQAAQELRIGEAVIKADLGRLLLKLEALQAEMIQRATAPRVPVDVAIPAEEREAALELLRAPDLVGRIVEDLTACGLVGERSNKLVAYLAATSRKLGSPLAVLVQSSAAAGKSTLMDAVLGHMPEEDRVKYSAVTGQSLFYVGSRSLKHKILAIAEEEGAARAAYALKLLNSEGELVIASTGKDPVTGNLVTQEYRVEGPTMLFTTTTAIDVDEELRNRCLVLAVDESRDQTRAIHALQRRSRTLGGLIGKARRAEIQKLHANAQRLLRPVEILNPYAERLTFPDAATRSRRDHEKYLTLIDTVALLHQHQREMRTRARDGVNLEYIEVTLADIALANELAHEILGRSLDELPPHTRRVLGLIDAQVRAECARLGVERAAYRFSRRGLRERLGMGDTQLRLHLDRLTTLEYVLARREGPGGRFVYELVYDGGGEDGRPFVPGLIEATALGAPSTAGEVAGRQAQLAAPARVDRGPVAGGSRLEGNAETFAGAPVYADSTGTGANPQGTRKA